MPSFTSLHPIAQAARAALLATLPALLASAHAAETAPAAASTPAAQPFNIPAGPLARAVNQFAAEAGVQLSVDAALTANLSSPGLQGRHTPASGFAALLAGTGLAAVQRAAGEYTLQKAVSEPQAAPSGQTGAEAALPEVKVLAQAARPEELPQAYAGGQVARGSRVGLLGNKDFMETPFSTVSYTDDYVQNRQAQDIGSVIGAADASIYVPSKRSIFESFFIRGFQTSADDITFNGLAGMAPNMRGATELAERIEVLKGPSALLNGMLPEGSVAGSVNLVPKRAGDKPLTRLTTTYESDSLWGAHVDLGRRFGENKEWGIRFNGVYRDGETAVNNQQHKMELASLGLDWRGQRARFSVDAYKQKERMDGVNYFGIFMIDNSVTQIPSAKKGDYSLAPSWAFNTTDTKTVVLRGEVDLTDSITAYAAWGQRKGGYNSLVTWNGLLNNAGSVAVEADRQVNNSSTKSAELGLRGKFQTGGLQHMWSLSATQYARESAVNYAFVGNHAITNYYDLDFGTAPDFSGFSTRGIPKTNENKLRSLAIADTLSFANGHVQLTLGLRNQNVKSHYFSSTTGAQTSGYAASKTSPAIALLVKATDKLSIYANYIEGLSQGGTAPTTAVNANEGLPPYQTKQHEIGVKLDQGSFVHTVSLFQIQKPSAFTDPATRIYGNYGEQRNRGIEWNFFGEPWRGVRLLGGASYTQAQLTKTLNGVNEGHQVTGVPKVIAKLGAEYDVTALPGLTLTGNLTYAGKRYVTNDNRLSLPAYTVFDIGARYATKVASKPVTLRATVQNVANKAYWLGSWYGSDGSGLSGGLGAPRTFLLSASVDF